MHCHKEKKGFNRIESNFKNTGGRIMKKFFTAIMLMVFALALSSPSLAAEKEVKIGLMWPLTGSSAYIGQLLKSVTDLCEDLVNNSYDIDSPGDIIRSRGLPNLGGVKIKLIYADNEGNPDVGRAAAERLITVDKVHALFGSEMSSNTLTESAVAEKYGIPMMNGTSTSPTLTARGFKYFFRTTPHAEGLVGTILDFLMDLNKTHNAGLKRIAVICEDTQWGQDAAKVIRRRAEGLGLEIVVDIPYPHEATDVEAEVLRIKKANPDVIFMSSYDADAILFQRTYKKYDVNALIVGNGTGHLDRIFVDTVGRDANYVLTRDLWSDSMLKSIPIAAQLNELLLKRGIKEGMGEEQGRTYVAFIALVDAINRAGSSDPNAIRQALTETNIPGKLLALPWEGVKFDKDGENIYGNAIITQWQNRELKAVWPWQIAETKVVWKLPPWSQR
jgi:branched-chain amino acid transport system substrate-binding protein